MASAGGSVGGAGTNLFTSDKKDKMLVAAIDFGTTYSGYAFSFKGDYEKDPANVSANQGWNAGSMSLLSLKTPTCVLFDENKQFHSFGYEAENFYSELAMDEDHEKWYFFKRFKMRLQGKKINRDVEVEDCLGKEMPAKTVFGEVIRYLKGHLLKALHKQGTLVENKDIHWILTVPAIWSDSAKQFMREAAYLAEIDGAQLTIALEPEAASLYCQLLPVDKIHGSNGAKFAVASPGTKYMVIDLGGGTADITVHERQTDSTLRELHKPDGGPWGGATVDEQFFQMIIKLITAGHFREYTKKHTADYIDLQRELETKKRTITKDTNGKVTIKVPVSLADFYNDECDSEETIDEAIENSPFKGKITWKKDKFRIDAELFKACFKPCCDKIVQKILELLKDPKVKGTNIFLMVGGFSESAIIQDAITSALPNGKVIIPDEAGLAVLKGAVIFGHQPVSIRSRVAKYTYGINISPPFDQDNHPPDHKVTVNGVDRCRDVFKKYIQEGDTVQVGEAKSGKHITLKANQKEMLLNIYASPKRDPKFVDDQDTELLGHVVVKLPDKDERIKVEVKMMFGETELHVEAIELSTHTKYRAFFDFL